jgi:hypothetical protein
MISGEFRELVQRKAWVDVDRELGRLAEQAYAGEVPMETLDVHEEYVNANGYSTRSGFYSKRDDLKVLEGFEIISIHLTGQQTQLIFFGRAPDRGGREAVFLNAEPECCEDVWWNHGSGLEALAPGCVIREARVIRSYYEGLAVTRQSDDNMSGLRIWTNRGMADFELRASSNGYYSGRMVIKAMPYVAPPTFYAVTEDW